MPGPSRYLCTLQKLPESQRAREMEEKGNPRASNFQVFQVSYSDEKGEDRNEQPKIFASKSASIWFYFMKFYRTLPLDGGSLIKF